jgi:hypothetical protein
VSRPAAFPQPSEQSIQRTVFEHLAWRAAPATFAFHVPNGGWRSPTEGAIFKALGVRPGVPDLIAIKDGRTYALELKAKNGRLTPVQLLAIRQMGEAGAVIGVAYSLDAALDWLAGHGLLRRTGD